MKNSIILILALGVLIGCNLFGVGDSEFNGISISTEKQKYSLGELRVVNFTNTSKQILYLENCSWSLEKKVERKWEVVNIAICTPMVAGAKTPITNGETYNDTLRYSINSGFGLYRYSYSILNSNQKKIPKQFTKTNVFRVVE